MTTIVLKPMKPLFIGVRHIIQIKLDFCASLYIQNIWIFNFWQTDYYVYCADVTPSKLHEKPYFLFQDVLKSCTEI